MTNRINTYVSNDHRKIRAAYLQMLTEEKYFRPLFLTLVLDDEVGLDLKLKLSFEKQAQYLSKYVVKRFLRRLDKKIFKDFKKRVPRFVVIEMDGRNHVHMIFETPEHLSSSNFQSRIRYCLSRSPHIVNYDIRDVTDTEGLSRYLLKELTKRTDTVDIENCFFKEIKRFNPVIDRQSCAIAR